MKCQKYDFYRSRDSVVRENALKSTKNSKVYISPLLLRGFPAGCWLICILAFNSVFSFRGKKPCLRQRISKTIGKVLLYVKEVIFYFLQGA